MNVRNWSLALATCATSLAVLLGSANRAPAQEGQGKYITEATVRLIKLVNAANKDGFKLQDNAFSIGGGWLKQSTSTWVPLYTVQLTAGKDYRFLASGDADAKDVDLQVLNPNGKTVASDVDTDANATVNYRPATSGRYTVRIRLYGSASNLPCVCLALVMAK